MKTLINLLIIVFSIIGLSEAGFITHQKLTDSIPPCQPGFQCATVLEHPMTNIGPIPLASLGLIFYTTFLILGVLYYLDVDLSEKFGKLKSIDLIKYLSYIGFGFGTYLVVLMAFIIQGWCLYFLISSMICYILFILAQGLQK